MKGVTYDKGIKDNILGEITFDGPWRFTYYFPTGASQMFEYVTRIQVMKTGCVVLRNSRNNEIVVVPPNYLFVHEMPMEVAQ